ncbi:uncharacterized protein LOC110655308 isoform X2 [Hevea brasiliensis]|uniref:uncharacterized protein LOC110655308 isoform X2 n=1 Tax=Hevea brasiliensis TaxID=3981 RepID=UPI0025E8E3E3|nr:uncharacterized protein LOC110655308 isoform X2 [Hevea brasiliensis]
MKASSRVQKAKKSFRKKTRRKGKQNKKVSSHCGLTELEVLSDYAYDRSTSETCSYNDRGDGLSSYETLPEVSLSEDSINCSGAPKSIMFNSDEFDMVETTISSMEHQVINSDIGIQEKDYEFSVLDGRMTEAHIQINCDGDMHSKSFSNIPESLVLDSVSVGSYGDDGINANHDVKPFDKGSGRVCFVESLGINSMKCLLDGAVDMYDHTKETKHGIQNISGSNVQFLVPGQKGKHIKTMPRSSTVYKFGDGQTGKESNRSIWLKVERNDVDVCNCEFKNVPMCSQFDVALKGPPLLKRNCNVPAVCTSSGPEDKKQPKRKASKKLKRKNRPGSKQEYNCYNGRSPHSSKASLNSCGKANMHKNEILDIPARVVDKKGVKSISKGHTQNACLQARSYNNRVECVNFESDISPIFPNGIKPPVGTCNSVSDIKNYRTESKDNSMPKSCNFLDQKLSEVHPPIYLPHLLGGKVSQVENEVTLEGSKKNHSSISTLQKWIPIGVKVPGLTTISSSSLDHFDGPAEDWTLRDTVEEKVISNSQDLVSSLTLGVDKGSGNASWFSHEDNTIQNLKNLNAFMVEHKNNLVTSNCLISKPKDQNYSVSEVESKKIAQAVSDACRIQLVAEDVHMAIGGPIAEFERVLHFSSPVICQSPSLLCCQTCFQDQLVDVVLCRHETPNISLGCLWQWYEKHGSYGLEIKAEDYNSRRLGFDHLTFYAYFVPYLSAVQLFKSHASQHMRNSDKVPSPGLVQTCEISESSDNCNIGQLPIFSLLVPQRRTRDASESVDMTWPSDIELLFEYFESDQPQRRLPLYEKIQELVRSDESTQHKMYGDPTNLVSVNLYDLHPRSWYSVAWYPIYRIPDSNFRATFLTYHSLGHFVRRGTKFDSHSMDACVVSPVVGLQSYNAQNECWFQLRHIAASQTTGFPSRILKEQLKTLEEAASLMSKAVVNKGSEMSVNRHPDYEFFLSRRS